MEKTIHEENLIVMKDNAADMTLMKLIPEC